MEEFGIDYSIKYYNDKIQIDIQNDMTRRAKKHLSVVMQTII